MYPNAANAKQNGLKSECLSSFGVSHAALRIRSLPKFDMAGRQKVILPPPSICQSIGRGGCFVCTCGGRFVIYDVIGRMCVMFITACLVET